MSFHDFSLVKHSSGQCSDLKINQVDSFLEFLCKNLKMGSELPSVNISPVSWDETLQDTGLPLLDKGCDYNHTVKSGTNGSKDFVEFEEMSKHIKGLIYIHPYQDKPELTQLDLRNQASTFVRWIWMLMKIAVTEPNEQVGNI